MYTIQKTNEQYTITFELDYTYPTHKNTIDELFTEALSNDKLNLVVDLSKVQIIDIASFRAILNGILRAKNMGREIKMLYPEKENDNYISRIFELVHLDNLK